MRILLLDRTGDSRHLQNVRFGPVAQEEHPDQPGLRRFVDYYSGESRAREKEVKRV